MWKSRIIRQGKYEYSWNYPWGEIEVRQVQPGDVIYTDRSYVDVGLGNHPHDEFYLEGLDDKDLKVVPFKVNGSRILASNTIQARKGFYAPPIRYEIVEAPQWGVDTHADGTFTGRSEPKCTCGAHSVKSTRHSSWCDLSSEGVEGSEL